MRASKRQLGFSVSTALLAVLFLTGCGQELPNVRGQVTYGGKPVPQGLISFEPTDGKGQTSAAEIHEGTYELQESARLQPGTYVVRVQGFRKTGRRVPVMGESEVLADETVPLVPAVYNAESKLTATIEANQTNIVDFHLPAVATRP